MRCLTRTSALTWLLAVSVSGYALAATAAPVAITENGKVTGIVAEGMKEFLGIRYAAPPVGALRWQPPQPVPQSLATTQATAFGPHCAQLPSAYGVASTTEDCLYLNVFVPNRKRPANAPKLPVMFWIHGGALVVGESDSYDPANLVTKGDVIVVTINYRLGYLGYLATAGLDAEGHVAANYGLQDQQFALNWVQRNIAGFGGDPTQVTVSGESAGGLSTLSNLVSPTAYGLFSRAIVESGAYALTLPTLSQAETAGAAVASGIGCAPTDTACLRSATVAQILAQEENPNLSLTTIIDGTTLPLSINTALAAGRFNRVPVLNGSNHDEYRQFLSADAALSAADYPFVLAGLYGDSLAAAIAAEYPVGHYALPVYALAAAISDQTFICTARQVDLWTAKYVPTFAYEFNDRHAPQDFLPPVPGYDFGAAHASELQFLFNVGALPAGVRPLNAAEKRLSAAMVMYWTNFVSTASPAGRGTPYWANFAPGTDNVQSLLPPVPVPETDFSAVHHCAFWKPLIDPSPQAAVKQQ
jgi:para-nitrobenzyl esterase